MKWGNLPEFDGKYEVSDAGLVRNIQTGKELKGTIDKDGYLNVGLDLQRAIDHISWQALENFSVIVGD